MNGFIIVFGLLIFMIGLYLLSYSLNKNTPIPEGVQEVEKCSTCHSGSCTVRDRPESKECTID